MTYTEEDFERMVGSPPELDDMERLNCEHAGALLHMCCGYCETHDKPRFVCGCIQRIPEKDDAALQRFEVPSD